MCSPGPSPGGSTSGTAWAGAWAGLATTKAGCASRLFGHPKRGSPKCPDTSIMSSMARTRPPEPTQLIAFITNGNIETANASAVDCQERAMFERLLKQLEGRDRVSYEERVLVERLPRTRGSFQNGQELVSEGSRPGENCLVLSGFTARAQLLAMANVSSPGCTCRVTLSICMP
jgi:hypothetical protein